MDLYTANTIFILCIYIFIFYCAFRINRRRKQLRKQCELFNKVMGDIDNMSPELVQSIDEKVRVIHDRLNLLAKENIKLNEKNEILIDKLRNLGVTNFDFMD